MALEMKHTLRHIIFTSALIFISACATKTVMRTEGPIDPEKEIPSEIVRSFEVTEQPRGVSGPRSSGPSVAHEGVAAPTEPVASKQKNKATAKKEKKSEPPAAAQGFKVPNRRPKLEPFYLNEKVTYDVTWMKTTAGEMTTEALPIKYIEGRKVYHFRGTARTTTFISHIYNAEEVVESFVDYEGLFPYKFTLRGDESKHIRVGLELFDHAKSKQYVYVKDDRLNGDVKEDKGIKDLTQFAQDPLSLNYYLRVLDFRKDEPMVIPVTAFGRMSDVKITWVDTESIKTKAGRFEVRKLRVQVHYKREKNFDDNYFWVTNDDRRLIVKFEMKVRIGWVGGVAKEVIMGTPFHGNEAK